jgi:hypothetical protein
MGKVDWSVTKMGLQVSFGLSRFEWTSFGLTTISLAGDFPIGSSSEEARPSEIKHIHRNRNKPSGRAFGGGSSGSDPCLRNSAEEQTTGMLPVSLASQSSTCETTMISERQQSACIQSAANVGKTETVLLLEDAHFHKKKCRLSSDG